MKKLTLLILFLFLAGIANCQSYSVSNPTIIATNNWDVKIITKASFMNVAYLLGYSTSIDHNNRKITLTSCYSDATPLPGGSSIITTVDIGFLFTGVNYTLNYTVFLSSNTSSCIATDTTIQTYTINAGPNSVEEFTRSFNFNISPNPTFSKVQVNWSNEIQKPNSIKITDLFGREIKILTSPSSGQEIDLSELSEGIYLVIIEIEGVKKNYKIIKE